MMTKTKLGIVLGMGAGVVDVIPMLIQKLPWDADLSAFCLWIVSGFLIATTNIKSKGATKGIIIASLVLLPSAIIIGGKEPWSLIPIAVMTLILGSALGYSIDRYGGKSS